MAVDSYQLEKWSLPPEWNEGTRCLEAMARVKTAVEARFGTSMKVYLQGSYKNGMNVKPATDADIALEYTRYYFSGIDSLSSLEKRKYEASRIHAEYPFEQYKRDIFLILEEEFGSPPVQWRDKCLFVRGHKYRVNVVVAPCYSYKRFSAHNIVEAEGIALVSDGGLLLESFPRQHYDGVVLKNLSTGERYSAVVRALKNTRDVMVDTGLIDKMLMPSFLLESLVWNVPNTEFVYPEFHYTVKQIVARICKDMDDSGKAKNYTEVCGLQWLLRGPAADLRLQNAINFMNHAYHYIGF